ncbi:hypothetical protein BN128_1982 [Cronobacter sakazakii 696]|nr:hypothetical protein BN128_1982 [Cronobacter sakazakii 696]
MPVLPPESWKNATSSAADGVGMKSAVGAVMRASSPSPRRSVMRSDFQE